MVGVLLICIQVLCRLLCVLGRYRLQLIILINSQRMRKGYSTHLFVCVCMCVTYDSGGSADLQH